MLQIIGWTLCAGLLCWGVSIFGNANYQTEDAEGRKKLTEAGNMAAILAIIAACAFAFLLYVQGRPVSDAYSYGSSSTYDSMSADAMASDADIEAAAQNAMAGAEAAAAAADAAAAEAIANE